VVKTRLLREWVLLQVLLEASEDPRGALGQITHAHGRPELTVHQLQIEPGIEHILDIGFVSRDKIGIGENLLLFQELPLVEVFDALLILLLVVDENRDVQMLLSPNHSDERCDLVGAPDRGDGPGGA
jgi:hypothetical protein